METMMNLLQAVGLGLFAMLPLANPLTSIVMFLSLSGHMTPQQREQEARKAGVFVFCILITAFYVGQLIMRIFGISVPGLRIAGGLTVLIIGLRMLFPQETRDNAVVVERKNEELRTYQSKSIAFVPIAMPGTAGPGSIAMCISLSASVHDGGLHMPVLVYWTAPVITAALLGVILWISLHSSSAIVRVIKESGIEAITRLMGFLLVCMGVQFGINGVLEIVHSFAAATTLQPV